MEKRYLKQCKKTACETWV